MVSQQAGLHSSEGSWQNVFYVATSLATALQHGINLQAVRLSNYI